MTNPKHTDTSRSGDLVEWLRDWLTVCSDGEIVVEPICEEIADHIEALQGEVDRLREALENIGNLSLNGCIKVNTALGQWIGTPDAYAREVLGMPWRSAALGEKQ